MPIARAWLLVEEMNGCFAAPLVETRPGAGAQLSDDARAVLAAYRKAEAAAETAAARELTKVAASLKPR
jgi:molybdate transport system regulatory protein